MTLLSAGGPWTDPIAYFRAFTDCVLVGLLLLPSLPIRWVLLIGVPQTALIWVLCLLKLR
jgi:hypothetical protein